MLDPSEKQKIRRASKRLHWFFQIAMVIALAAIPFERDLRAGVADIFTHVQLGQAADNLRREFAESYRQHERELVAFIPPTNPDAREAWAVSIGEQIGQPSAVFLQQGRTLDWFDVPASCREALPQAETLLRTPADTLWTRIPADTLGAMLIRRAVFGLDSARSSALWQVGPLGDSLFWGTLQSGERYKNGLHEFYRRRAIADTAIRLNPRDITSFPPSSFDLWQPVVQPAWGTVRVSIDGTEIYRSPGLDTTAAGYFEEANGIRSEFFLGYADEAFRQNIAAARATWRSFILPILMMLTIFTLHRWILKLTEPDKP